MKHRRARILLPLFVALLLAGCAGALNLPGSGQRPATYTVGKSDTLYSIAWHYGLDYHSVAVWNGIKPPYTIYPGQRIRLYPTRRGARGTAMQSGQQHVAHSEPTGKTVPAPANQPSEPVVAGPIHWQWPSQGRAQPTYGKQGVAGKGIVINGQLGAAVRASAAGTVVYSGSALVGYGRLIIIKHNDEWLSAYGHNQRLLVHEGDSVKAGQKIATMGLGPNDKPALYFEIRRDGKPVDPLRYLPKPG
ncbi:MAG: peptidoglycan DD-metalloendopeptidase family protein [Gammaproteobacteria bacterium]